RCAHAPVGGAYDGFVLRFAAAGLALAVVLCARGARADDGAAWRRPFVVGVSLEPEPGLVYGGLYAVTFEVDPTSRAGLEAGAGIFFFAPSAFALLHLRRSAGDVRPGVELGVLANEVHIDPGIDWGALGLYWANDAVVYAWHEEVRDALWGRAGATVTW